MLTMLSNMFVKKKKSSIVYSFGVLLLNNRIYEHMASGENEFGLHIINQRD